MSLLHDSIAQTRTLLTEEAERLHHAAVQSDDGQQAAYMARVVVEAEHAADALFSVMNAAQSYLDDPDAEAVMFPEGRPKVAA